MSDTSTPKPVQRRLRVTGFEGTYFGEDIIELSWRAEDGSKAKRLFKPSVWDVMPDWAERRYEAAVTAHPVTRFDVERVSPIQSPAPPAPAVAVSGLSAPSLYRSHPHARQS